MGITDSAEDIANGLSPAGAGAGAGYARILLDTARGILSTEDVLGILLQAIAVTVIAHPAFTSAQEADFHKQLQHHLKGVYAADTQGGRYEEDLNYHIKQLSRQTGASALESGLSHRLSISAEQQRWLDIARQALLFARELMLSGNAATPQGKQYLLAAMDAVLRQSQEFTRYAGEFSSPVAVARLMAELAAPSLSECVYDPCFGTGSLLVEALRVACARTEDRSRAQGARGCRAFGFAHGAELRPELRLIAHARLLLAGEEAPRLTVEDALYNLHLDTHPGSMYDCILAHPPYGARPRQMGAYGGHSIPFPTQDLEALFLQHIARKLRPGGRAVVLVSEGLLFRSGTARLRHWLLRDYRVDAVVALPEGALKPLTATYSSLLLFSHRPRLSDVVFVGSEFTKRHLLPDSNLNPADDLQRGPSGELTVALQAVLDYRSSLQENDRSPADVMARQVLAAEAYRQSTATASVLSATKDPVHRQRTRAGLEDVLDLARIAGVSLSSEYEHLLSPETGAQREPIARLIEPVLWLTPVEDLAQRQYELVAKPAQADLLAEFLNELVRNGVPVFPLAEVTSVTGGLTTNRENVVDSEQRSVEYAHVPLVRVRDVSRASGQADATKLPSVRRGGWWVSRHGLERVRQSQYLRQNDVLLTISATVGAVAWVDDETAGGVPAQGVAAIRADRDADRDEGTGDVAGGTVRQRRLEVTRALPQVRPEYLLRLLQSEPYHQWFTSHARGTAIRHLNLSKLRDLPIPVPEEGVQLFLAETLQGGESASTLLALFSRAGGALYWQHFIETAPELRRLRNLMIHSPRVGSPTDEDASELYEIISAWVERTPQWRARAEADRESEPIAVWLLRWTRAAEELNESRRLPLGADRYALLHLWRRQFVPLLEEVGAPEVQATAAPQTLETASRFAPLLQRALETLCEHEEQLLLSLCQIRVSAAPSILAVGEESSVQIEMHNQGALGLRNLYVRAAGHGFSFASEDATFLPVGGTHVWGLTLPPPAEGPVVLTVSWRAQRLDGSDWRGEAELPFVARIPVGPEGIEPTAGRKEFEKSPYVVGNPIDNVGDFYGREPQIDRIRRLLRDKGAGGVVLLEGNRRAGKTSLLYQLRRPDVMGGFLGAYLSLQSGSSTQAVAGLSTGEILYNIARVLILVGYEAGLTFPLSGVDLGEPVSSALSVQELKLRLISQVRPIYRQEYAFEVLDDQVAAICAAAAPKRILLLLDEFDKVQEGIDSGLTSPQLPENIRSLFHKHNAFSGILTGSRRIQRLRDEYWHALFGIGMRVDVTSLDEEPARRLVTEPSARVLHWAPAAVAEVLRLTARQPFLIQTLCSHTFSLCAEVSTGSVTLNLVKDAAERLAKDFEHFRTMWNYIGTARRRFLLCLIDRLETGRDRVTLPVLTDRVYDYRIQYGRRLLQSDLDELKELELVEQTGHASKAAEYRIGIPLLTQWMRHNTDFERQLEDAIDEPEEGSHER